MLRVALLVSLASLTPPSAAGQSEAGLTTPFSARFEPAAVKSALAGEAGFEAIGAGLAWLAENQAADGSWSSPGSAEPSADATALAVLALLGDGHSKGAAKHRMALVRGVAWLTANKTELEGAPVRARAAATTALAEASHYLDDGRARAAAGELARFIGETQRPDGSWSESAEDGSPVASAWCASALSAADELDVADPKEALAASSRWLRGTVAKTGAVRPGAGGGAAERATAAVLCARLRLGDEPDDDKRLARQANRLVRKKALPAAGGADFEYWLFGTEALARLGGKPEAVWKDAVRVALVEPEVRTADGSWRPGEGASDAASATALAVLALEAPYRFREAAPKEQPAPDVTPAGVSDELYGGRFGERPDLRAAGGASTAVPLERALAWLASAQQPDGSFASGPSDYPVGVSALALLALLGAGNTPQYGPHKQAVSKGLEWLLTQQDKSTGRFGTEGQVRAAYEHAVATLVLGEAYLFEKAPLLKAALEPALRHIEASRNGPSGWRYESPPNGESDTSVTTWMVAALRTAAQAELAVDSSAFVGAAWWLHSVTDAQSGRVGYDGPRARSSRLAADRERFPPDLSEAMTAAALFQRFLLGQDPREYAVMVSHSRVLLLSPPRWSEDGSTCDMYYWYWGSLAMHQMGGKNWSAWNRALKAAVLSRQNEDGSWDPVGPWGQSAGRVYSTAMIALSLEVYFRYGKILAR